MPSYLLNHKSDRSYIDGLEITICKEPLAKFKNINKNFEETITKLFTDTFQHVYQNETEESLGLKSSDAKEKWLARSIEAELQNIKDEKLELACGYLNDQLIGFITWTHENSASKNSVDSHNQTDFSSKKTYISQLAVKDFTDMEKNFTTNKERIRLGVGAALMNLVEKSAPGNILVVDTRKCNQNATNFYLAKGFIKQPNVYNTNNEHYFGLKKQTISQVRKFFFEKSKTKDLSVGIQDQKQMSLKS